MKVGAVCLAVLALAGCVQCSAFFDGVTGLPADQLPKEEPAVWYHLGHLMMPVISQILAIGRIVLPLVIPLLFDHEDAAPWPMSP